MGNNSHIAYTAQLNNKTYNFGSKIDHIGLFLASNIFVTSRRNDPRPKWQYTSINQAKTEVSAFGKVWSYVYYVTYNTHIWLKITKNTAHYPECS